MDWTRAFDNYCERTDLTYWSEPVNALTNLAFIFAALIMWHRCKGRPEGRFLAATLFAIGVGSWLFHTHATVWAVIMDVIPIMVFGLFYIYLANRHYWGLGIFVSALGAALFIPYSAAINQVASALPFFEISAGYWAFPTLIAIYAGLLWRRDRSVSVGLFTGAAILCASLVFRSLDGILCPSFTLGTHFMWHILNAIMLGWMIEVWRRQRIAANAR